MNKFEQDSSWHDELQQVVENLNFILESTRNLTPIERDIILQHLRDAYLAVLKIQAIPLIEPAPLTPPAPKAEPVAEPAPVATSELKEETAATPTAAPIAEPAPVIATAPITEPAPLVEPATTPKAATIVEIETAYAPEPTLEPVAEPALTTELKEEIVVTPTPAPIVEPAAVIATAPINKPAPLVEPATTTTETIPVIETVTPTEPVSTPIVEPEVELEIVSEPATEEPTEVDDDILDFLTTPLTQSTTAISPTPAPRPTSPVRPTNEQPRPQAQPTLFPDEPVATQPATRRSLNDLLMEQKTDNSIAKNFQNSPVTDLAKAISINDKFLFIKELFNGKGDEFGLAIQKLNRCQTLEEAFNEIDIMKTYYGWDTAATAYLTLCDFVRRKFV